jgi:hypothetical protein
MKKLLTVFMIVLMAWFVSLACREDVIKEKDSEAIKEDFSAMRGPDFRGPMMGRDGGGFGHFRGFGRTFEGKPEMGEQFEDHKEKMGERRESFQEPQVKTEKKEGRNRFDITKGHAGQWERYRGQKERSPMMRQNRGFQKERSPMMMRHHGCRICRMYQMHQMMGRGGFRGGHRPPIMGRDTYREEHRRIDRNREIGDRENSDNSR